MIKTEYINSHKRKHDAISVAAPDDVVVVTSMLAAYEVRWAKTTDPKEREKLLTEITKSGVIAHPETVAMYYDRSTLTTAQRAWFKRDNHKTRVTRRYIELMLTEKTNYMILQSLKSALDTSPIFLTALNEWMRKWLERLESNANVTAYICDGAPASIEQLLQRHKMQRSALVVFYPSKYQRYIPLEFERASALGSRTPYYQHFNCNLYLERDLAHATVVFQSSNTAALQPPSITLQQLNLFRSFITFEVYV
jgi:hypothetical protein